MDLTKKGCDSRAAVERFGHFCSLSTNRRARVRCKLLVNYLNFCQTPATLDNVDVKRDGVKSIFKESVQPFAKNSTLKICAIFVTLDGAGNNSKKDVITKNSFFLQQNLQPI